MSYTILPNVNSPVCISGEQYYPFYALNWSNGSLIVSWNGGSDQSYVEGTVFPALTAALEGISGVSAVNLVRYDATQTTLFDE